ncbi:hypothetical protein [Herbidospora mongoliensis]|uniref:hypothetical protein n=1 Tax=Herbidospora mongoliensis TaxID=688067 RepID=UPI0012FC356C|nr:hypothetical protein [Herbidospora mongoliensis]
MSADEPARKKIGERVWQVGILDADSEVKPAQKPTPTSDGSRLGRVPPPAATPARPVIAMESQALFAPIATGDHDELAERARSTGTADTYRPAERE